MSGDPVLTDGGQPYYEDLQPRKRMCRVGDTICTVAPRYGLYLHLHSVIETREACDSANKWIEAGKWRVSRCGRCGLVVEECTCDIPDA